jgi:hypothetical protein
LVKANGRVEPVDDPECEVEAELVGSERPLGVQVADELGLGYGRVNLIEEDIGLESSVSHHDSDHHQADYGTGCSFEFFISPVGKLDVLPVDVYLLQPRGFTLALTSQ